MSVRREAVEALLDLGPAMLARVETAKGSTPREAGAWMLVGARRTVGTVGGGQLEYIVIDAARALMARGGVRQVLDVPLGPEIGQCCGGRTRLTVVRAEGPTLERLMAAVDRARARLPSVYVIGAGHVGRALAACLALLPVRCLLVDGRDEELAMGPAGVERVLTRAARGRGAARAGGVGLRGDDARPCARLPGDAGGAGAGGRGLCRDDRVADEARVVLPLAARGGAGGDAARSSVRSERRGGRTSGRR